MLLCECCTICQNWTSQMQQQQQQQQQQHQQRNLQMQGMTGQERSGVSVGCTFRRQSLNKHVVNV